MFDVHAQASLLLFVSAAAILGDFRCLSFLAVPLSPISSNERFPRSFVLKEQLLVIESVDNFTPSPENRVIR